MFVCVTSRRLSERLITLLLYGHWEEEVARAAVEDIGSGLAWVGPFSMPFFYFQYTPWDWNICCCILSILRRARATAATPPWGVELRPSLELPAFSEGTSSLDSDACTVAVEPQVVRYGHGGERMSKVNVFVRGVGPGTNRHHG